jgi:hypothetical protein
MVTLDGTQIEPMSILGLTPEEKTALMAFLLSLTDEQVRFQRAPFDHPQLFVPNGVGAPRMIMPGDQLMEIPAVGASAGRRRRSSWNPDASPSKRAPPSRGKVPGTIFQQSRPRPGQVVQRQATDLLRESMPFST